MDKEENRKRYPLRRTMAFLTTLALVLGALFLVVNWPLAWVATVRRP